MFIEKFSIIMTNKLKRFLIVFLAIILLTVIINCIIFDELGNNVLVGRHIIIDPGHGGIDLGTNDNYLFFEKDVNLNISKKLSDVIESNKAYTVLTRTTDTELYNNKNISKSRHECDLLQRISEINSGKYKVFLTIHINRSVNNRVSGPYVFYSPKFTKSVFLAQCLQNRLNKYIKITTDDRIDRKPIKANYFILKNANIPGVLIETGFISNSEDKNRLIDTDYQTKLAQSICAGLKDYFKGMNNLKQNEYMENNSIDKDEGVPFNIVNEIKLVQR